MYNFTKEYEVIGMTKLLDSAFKKASTLPETEQDIFARFIIHEIKSEKKWEDSFSQTQDLLSDLADDALADFKNDKTVELQLK